MAKLLAGAAMRKITPSLEMLKRMKEEDPKSAFDGIHEDIYVRAIVLSDGKQRVLLGGSDLGRFPAQNMLADRLNRDYGIDRMGCILSCTHNHEEVFCGLNVGDDLCGMVKKCTPSTEEYTLWVLDMMVEAVAEAIEKWQPAKMGVGKCESYINACRDLPTPIGGIQLNNFHGPSDHELVLLKFIDLKGETIGMFANHATHSNAMVWNVYDKSYPKIQGDVGGGISLFVERANKNKFPVAWAVGAIGDQNPIVRSTWRSVEVDDEGNFRTVQTVFDYKTNLAQMQALIATQGLEILELADKITDYTDEFNFKSDVTYREIPSRKSYISLGLYPDVYSPVNRQLLPGERPEPVPGDKPVKFRFQLTDICGVAFACFNNEPYSALGMMVKQLIPVKTTVVIDFCFGHVGYIPDEKGEWINGFGTGMSPARSGAESQAAFLSGFKELVTKIYG